MTSRSYLTHIPSYVDVHCHASFSWNYHKKRKKSRFPVAPYRLGVAPSYMVPDHVFYHVKIYYKMIIIRHIRKNSNSTFEIEDNY